MDVDVAREVSALTESLTWVLSAEAENLSAAAGHDPLSWASITVTQTLAISGADADGFIVDCEGRDHPLASAHNAVLIKIAAHHDSEAHSIRLFVENTLESDGDYTLDLELGYRSDGSEPEFVRAPRL